MKNLKKVLIAILSVVVLAACSVCFVACGEKSDNGEGEGQGQGSIVGTYKFVSQTYTVEGETQTIKAGEGGVTEDYYVVVLSENGTFTQTMTMGEFHDSNTGTWTQEGNTIHLTVDGDVTDGTIDGDKITFSTDPDDGFYMSITVKKVK